MTVKAYCDCSGKTENRSLFLTLASYFATEQSWDRLESQWPLTLKNYDALYFHAREAMSLRASYKGWGLERVTRLVSDLFNILGQMDRDDFFGTSCTVDLEQYHKAKATIPRLRSPEEICLDFCMGTVFRHPKRDCGIELLFDRGEQFQRVMQRLWQRRGPKRIWWADKGHTHRLRGHEDEPCSPGGRPIGVVFQPLSHSRAQ